MPKILIQSILFVLAIVFVWPATFVVLRIDPGLVNVARIVALLLLLGNVAWILASVKGGSMIVAHALLFLLAAGVFIVGLGLGLQFNPTYGSILLVAAVAIFVLNLVWIVRSGQSGRG